MLNGISLSSIRAFEAAARLGSFRAAADELHLSASAVSHAIVKLERALGTPLFERTSRTVRLTPDGQTLLSHASNAFEELRCGIERVSATRSHLLRLHCAPSFAAQVLSPRLPGFLAANPGIEVRLAASTTYVRFVDGEFDADIIYGQPKGDDLVIVPLGEERVTPLCTPEIAESIKSPGDILSKVQLVQTNTRSVRRRRSRPRGDARRSRDGSIQAHVDCPVWCAAINRCCVTDGPVAADSLLSTVLRPDPSTQR